MSAVPKDYTAVAGNDLDVPAVIEREAPASSLLETIARAARDPAVDVDKIERLLALKERTEQREAEREFNRAMNEAQGEIAPIAADAQNPQTRSKYATYLALDRVLRPIYVRHGFAISYDTKEAPENFVIVLAYVMHRDGHSKTFQCTMPADGKGARGGDVMTRTHATGAAFTYSQRYLLKLIFNIAIGPDDDGNSASDVMVEELFKLLKESGADQDAFCRHFGISAVADLPRKEFQRAKDMLARKMGPRKAPEYAE